VAVDITKWPQLTIAALFETTYRGQGGLWGALMKRRVAKHSVVIHGHKTSVSLEDAFWRDLKDIAHAQQVSLGGLVERIEKTRHTRNLSSAIRLFVLEHFKMNRSSQNGHAAVSNGHAAVSVEGMQVTEP